MIFVAAGTHHQPFDRLVLAADQLAASLDEVVVLQHGTSTCSAPHCEAHRDLPADVFEAKLMAARVVVLHAGSSSFLQARALGRVPIVVPRRPEHGEHVDDHQVRFAASIEGQALVVEPEALAEAVAGHDDPGCIADPEARSRAFAAKLDALLANLR